MSDFRRKSVFHTQLTDEETEIYKSVKSYFQQQSEIAILNENPVTSFPISEAIFKRIYQEFTEVNNDADPTTLTKEEFFIVIHQKSPHLSEAQIDGLFSIFDDDNDGKIDINEYCFQMLNSDSCHPELKEIHEDMHWLKKVVDHDEHDEVDLKTINDKLNSELTDKFMEDNMKSKGMRKSVSIFEESNGDDDFKETVIDTKIEEIPEIRLERENLTILTLKYKSGKAVRARF